MKFLFLSKRHPMGRDLFERPYGRFYYIPKLLAERGHEVCLHLASYQFEPPLNGNRDDMRWMSTSMRNFGPLGYVWRSAKLAREIRPDWIIGFSDTYFGILAVKLAQRYGARSVIDAYDNYESYLPWAGILHKYWRVALQAADVVTAAGPELANHMGNGRARAHVVPMAADPEFTSLDRAACRTELGLPPNVPLIGYCGSMHPNRGIEVLFTAFDQVRTVTPSAQLILTGRLHPSIRLPSQAKYLGYLADRQIPKILNAIDVLTVINRDSDFGRHSYPVKLYEAMACQIPVVAASTPATRWIMQGHEECLYLPGNSGDLCQKILSRLGEHNSDYARLNTWVASVQEFEQILARSHVC